MLMIRAQLTIRADDRAAFVEHLRDLAAESRAEAGCLGFDLYEAIGDSGAANRFVVLQEWRDRAALDQHEQSRHVAAFKAKAAALIIAREPTRVYTVSQVEGL